MTWLVDGWLRCPGCKNWGDAAALLGESSYRTRIPHTADGARIEGVEDGLLGVCDRCEKTFRIRIEIVDPPEEVACWVVGDERCGDCGYCTAT